MIKIKNNFSKKKIKNNDFLEINSPKANDLPENILKFQLTNNNNNN